MKAPAGLSGIEAMFGTFTWREPHPGDKLPRGFVVQDEGWVREHIIEIVMPRVGIVRCHRLVAPAFLDAVEAYTAAGEAHKITEIYCHCARHKMGNPKRELSTHSWGIAFDCNPSENPVGSDGMLSNKVIKAFEDQGFEWGGRWKTKDSMHFQMARLF